MSRRSVATTTRLALAVITTSAAEAAEHALTGTTSQGRHVRLGAPHAGRRSLTHEPWWRPNKHQRDENARRTRAHARKLELQHNTC